MSYDPIEIKIEEAPDPVQLDLFHEIVPSPEPPEKVVNQYDPEEGKVVHHIRSPDEATFREGESEATITPKLAEVSLKMARALTAKSRALSSKSKYFPE